MEKFPIEKEGVTPTTQSGNDLPFITWLPACEGKPVTGSTITLPVAESLA